MPIARLLLMVREREREVISGISYDQAYSFCTMILCTALAWGFVLMILPCFLQIFNEQSRRSRQRCTLGCWVTAESRVSRQFSSTSLSHMERDQSALVHPILSVSRATSAKCAEHLNRNGTVELRESLARMISYSIFRDIYVLRTLVRRDHETVVLANLSDAIELSISDG